MVHGLSLDSGNDDNWSWKDGVSLVFSVNSAYSILKGELEGDRSCLYKFFWSIKAFHAVIY